MTNAAALTISWQANKSAGSAIIVEQHGGAVQLLQIAHRPGIGAALRALEIAAIAAIKHQRRVSVEIGDWHHICSAAPGGVAARALLP